MTGKDHDAGKTMDGATGTHETVHGTVKLYKHFGKHFHTFI